MTVLYMMTNGYIYAIPKDGGVLNQTQFNVDYTFHVTEDGQNLDTALAGVGAKPGTVYVSTVWNDVFGGPLIRACTGPSWTNFGTRSRLDSDGPVPGGVGVDGSRVYFVQNWDSAPPVVEERDAGGALVVGYDLPPAHDPRNAYSAVGHDGWIYYIDGDTGNYVRARLSDGLFEVVVNWDDGIDFAVDPTTGHLWVVDDWWETLTEYDASGTQLRSYDFGLVDDFLGEPYLVAIASDGQGYVFCRSSAASKSNSYGAISRFTHDDLSQLDVAWGWWDWSQSHGPLHDSIVMNVPQGMVAFPATLPVRRLQTISGGTGS